MNGKRAVLMQLKSDEGTRFVGVTIARVYRIKGIPSGIVTRLAGTHAGDGATRRLGILRTCFAGRRSAVSRQRPGA